MALQSLLLLFLAFAGAALFGANTPAFSLPLTGVVGLLLAGGQGGPMFHKGPPLPRWLLAGWAMLMLWGVLQIVPLPPALALFAHPLQVNAAHTLSLAPQNGFLALLNGGLYAVMFVLAWRAAATEEGAGTLLVGLALIAVILAANGLFLYASGTQAVLWQPKVYYLGDLTSTFINRNSYATFAGLGVLCCLAGVLSRVGEIPSARRAGWRQRLKAVMVLVLKPRWPWMIAALAVFASLLLSHSRAGLAAFVLGLAVFMAVLVWRARGARPFLLGLALPLVVFGALTLAIAGEETFARMDQAGADAAVRHTIYTTTLQATAPQPLSGTGLGSFEPVFRLYRTPELSLGIPHRVDHAHNSWLEFALEMGWPALVLAAALAVGLGALFVRGLVLRKHGVVYPALGLASLVLVAAHGLVDFSPNIPGFSMFFAALMGLCAVQSLPREARTATPAGWGRWASVVAGVALAVPALYLGYPAALARQAEAVLADYRQINQPEGYQKPSSAQLAQARRQLQRAVAWWPYANWQRDVGLISLMFAERVGVGEAIVLRHDARQNLAAALAVQPADPYSWQRLAVIDLADRRLAADDLFNSLISGPSEPNLVWARLPLLMLLWPQLEKRDVDLLNDQLRTAWGSRPWDAWEAIKLMPGGPARLANAVKDMPGTPDLWRKHTFTAWPYVATAN